MLVISVDPGYGTGISVYDTDTGAFQTEEVIGLIEAAQRIHYWLDCEPCEVVFENFIVTQNTARLSGQNESLKLIGIGQWESYQRGHKFSVQMPAARKPGEAKLKALGWNRKTKDKHSDSASGHLLVFLLKNGLLRDEEKLKLMESL